MCRASAETGRRCPSHTNPKSIEERNIVRKEQYASKKFRDATARKLNEMEIPFVRGGEVKNTFFQGKNGDYTPENFKPVKDAPVYEEDQFESGFFSQFLSFRSKPEEGGLWTSPGRIEEDGSVKTEWTDLTNTEGVNNSDAPLAELKVKAAAVIVEIHSEEDLENLCKAFPTKGHGFSFEAMSKAGIDGLRLSDKGLAEAKGAPPEKKIHNFGMWDIDSTVWISNENISAGKPRPKGVYETSGYDGGYWYDEDEEREEEMSWDDLLAELKKSSETPMTEADYNLGA